MTEGIWISPTEFASFEDLSTGKKQALLEEIYTGGFLTGFDPVGWIGTLPDPDPVLRKSGDGVSVLRELTADPKVLSSIQQRKLGTLKKRDYVLEPGAAKGKDPDASAKNVCTQLEEDLEQIDLYNVFSQVLDAPYYGCAFVEILWEPAGGRLKIADLKPRPHEWFSFNTRHEPVYLGDGEPAPLPFGKAVVSRHFPDATNPFGLRLLSRCLWPVAIKKGGIRFWTILCERFGIPWVIGKAPTGAQKEKRAEIAAQLASMVQDAVAVVSAGTEVDINGISGTVGDLHPKLIEYMDKAIAMVLMGQTLTADIGDVGSKAASETHAGVLDDYREADETLICFFMEELSWIYTKINSPPGTLSPDFRYVEPADYKSQADLDGKLHTTGVRFTKIHYVKRYDLSEDEFELESDMEGKPKEDDSLKSDLAAPGEEFTEQQESIERMIADILPEAAEAAGEMTERVLSAVKLAETWEDLQILLAEELSDAASTEKLEELLGRMMLGGVLFGTFAEAADED